jgi:hypothetical protein
MVPDWGVKGYGQSRQCLTKQARMCVTVCPPYFLYPLPPELDQHTSYSFSHLPLVLCAKPQGNHSIHTTSTFQKACVSGKLSSSLWGLQGGDISQDIPCSFPMQGEQTCRQEAGRLVGLVEGGWCWLRW